MSDAAESASGAITRVTLTCPSCGGSAMAMLREIAGERTSATQWTVMHYRCAGLCVLVTSEILAGIVRSHGGGPCA
jgi:hypothetical protein